MNATPSVAKADRCAQALVHLKLAMQALDGMPEAEVIRADARALYIKLQETRRAEQPE
jgi:hypothetical protein